MSCSGAGKFIGASGSYEQQQAIFLSTDVTSLYASVVLFWFDRRPSTSLHVEGKLPQQISCRDEYTESCGGKQQEARPRPTAGRSCSPPTV